MKKAFLLSFLTFYLFGTLCLPFGDFSVIADLPRMYHHCKTNEDHDLDVLEFFAEHVSGIGQIIEGMEHEDESEDPSDKPHAPIEFSFQQQQVVCTIQQVKVPAARPIAKGEPVPVAVNTILPSGYIASIFRPPIV